MTIARAAWNIFCAESLTFSNDERRRSRIRDDDDAPNALVKVARASTALPAFVSLAFFQMIAMVGWMMMAMASRAVRVFYAASNAPLQLEDDGGAPLSRQPSRHGAEYDALVERGIPRDMLRVAWIVSEADPERAMAFVRNNFDQPGANAGGGFLFSIVDKLQVPQDLPEVLVGVRRHPARR